MRTINKEQFSALSKLADCVSAKAYADEKLGTFRGERITRHIANAIIVCDSLRVPYAVQLTTIDYGRKWKTYRNAELKNHLMKNDVVVKEA